MQLQNAPTIDVEEWIKRASELYHQIDSIYLVGSRARGCAGARSDYDLLVSLTPDCYTPDGEQVNKIEQRIAFDERLRDESLDVFFWRPPGGGIGRWDFGPNEEPPKIEINDDGDQYILDCLLHGYPEGDFNRFYKDLKHARLLFSRDGGAFPYPGCADTA